MSLVPDPVWAETINQVVLRMASGVRATGRAEDWGIDWPNNPLSFSPPFNNRTNDLTVVVEIANARGIGIARQTVTIPTGFDIHSRVSRSVIPRQWEGEVVFPAVDIHAMTDRLNIRVVSIDGVPAATAARQNGVTVMSNEELFRTAGIRRVPIDTSHFTVQANGTLTLWSGTGTEISIPSMVNGVRVTAIGNGVFQGRGLTSVTIPDTVTSIGNNAFRNNQLTEVILPGSVTVIGANAFGGNMIRSASIPDSVTSIGNEAFRGNQLTSVVIPDSVNDIHRWAFGTDILGRVNPLTSITIGADQMNFNRYSFGFGFIDFYTQNGRRAGTYTRSGNTWTFTAR